MAPLLAYRLRDFEGTFEGIYRRHVRDVYGFSLSMLGNAEDAEDVTQTTFLNAYRALQNGEQVRSLRAWLLAIAHNVCRQRFRTAARRPQEVALDPEVAEAYHDEDAPTAQEIRNAMSHLSFNQRTVLVLREIEGLAYEEIANAMGLSLSAVETLLFRARQALREQLEAAEKDLGCDAVQRLISLQLDGKLSRSDRGLMRAHLRSCTECARFARSQRARKRVMPSLIAVPLPASLTGAFQAGTFGAVGSKVAALAVSAALVGAGALVETGIVPTPGHAREKPAQVAAAPAADDAAAAQSLVLRAARELVTQGRATKPKQKAVAAKKTKKGAEANAASGGAADTQGAGGASSSGTEGSAGGETGAQPTAGTGGAGVPVVGDTVDDTVQGAQDKVPPLPVSPPVQPPSLPPVPLPGTGSLP
jgi:RNA polymerase sigma factor (sigma-70 family)